MTGAWSVFPLGIVSDDDDDLDWDDANCSALSIAFGAVAGRRGCVCLLGVLTSGCVRFGFQFLVSATMMSSEWQRNVSAQ